jgi:hypothetical protein
MLCTCEIPIPRKGRIRRHVYDFLVQQAPQTLGISEAARPLEQVAENTDLHSGYCSLWSEQYPLCAGINIRIWKVPGFWLSWVQGCWKEKGRSR